MNAIYMLILLILLWPWSYSKLGNIPYKWKHMTNVDPCSILHSLSHQVPLLLERNEQGYPEIYSWHCTLCQWEKAKVQSYPLQMTEIQERPFDTITINLVTECEMSTSGNKHILTIFDHFPWWLEAFLIPDKSADTIVSTFINHYLPVHMCPRYILLVNGTEFKDQVLQQLRIDLFSLHHTSFRATEN